MAQSKPLIYPWKMVDLSIVFCDCLPGRVEPSWCPTDLRRCPTSWANCPRWSATATPSVTSCSSRAAARRWPSRPCSRRRSKTAGGWVREQRLGKHGGKHGEKCETWICLEIGRYAEENILKNGERFEKHMKPPGFCHQWCHQKCGICIIHGINDQH